MSDECIFCHRDPYHYVDIGVGFQAAAVNCCDLGVALYQHGDEDLAKVANRIEALEETLKLRTTERNHANDIVDTYVDQVKALEANLAKAVAALQFWSEAVEPDIDKAIALMASTIAKIKGEQQ